MGEGIKIDLLLLDNGASTRDSEEIEEEIIKSLSNLFGPEVRIKPFLKGIDFLLCLGKIRCWWCCLPLQEIKKAIFSSECNKYPGADWFSMAFQKNWNMIKRDLEGVLRSSLKEAF